MKTMKLNTVLLACLSLLLAVQLLMITVVVYSFIPIKLNDFVKTLLPLYWDQVRPEREMFFYALFILESVVLQLAALLMLRRTLDHPSLTKVLQTLLGAEVFWVALQAMAAFKIIVFNNPAWARWMLYSALAAAVLSKIFWPEVSQWLKKVYVRLADTAMDWRPWVLAMDIAMPLLLVFLLYTPDITKVLAHVFAWDQFFHLDAFVMSPGWAYLHGLRLDVDTNSNYGVLIPVLWSKIAQWTGEFTYAHMLRVLMDVGILYYIGFYFLLRFWTKDALVSVFGVLLAVKLQMFHWGIWPLVWRFPSATPLRYFFDLLLMFCLARHALTGKRGMLWLAAASCGVLLAYMLDVGVYATAAFSAYVLFLLWAPQTRRSVGASWQGARMAIGLWLLPWVVGFVLLALVQGPTVFSAKFWGGMTEFSHLFLNGWYALPMTDGLKDKQFFAFIMGFVIPAVYVLTLMLVGVLSFFNRIHPRNNYIVFICLYGLGLYHYFIYRSAVTSYDVVVIPFVMVICFWVMKFLGTLPLRPRRLAAGSLAAATFLALLTSYLFTFYPNVLNLGGFDFTPETKAYQQAFDVSKDAAFIRRLTTPQEPVALISDEETRLLMAADRKPFFYFFPLIHTVPLDSKGFKGTDLMTIDRMRRTLGHLEAQKPERIFVEKKLWGGLPKEYYQHFQTLTILLQYIQAHYEPESQGYYLMAFKRKAS